MIRILAISTLWMAIFSPINLLADQVCQKLKLSKGKIKNTIVTIADGAKCPKGAVLILSQAQINTLSIQGSTGAQGPSGPQGAQGIDGSIRAYGDGSAGPLNIVTNTNWVANDSVPSNNFQFSDCNIASGVTFTVPSGTFIRCSGSAVISGAIEVGRGVRGSTFRIAASSLPNSASVPDYGYGNGVSGFYGISDAQHGMRGPENLNRQSGEGGDSIFSSTNTLPLNFFNIGHKGGGGGAGSLINPGGAGGGVFTLVAKNSITVSAGAVIRANGGSGSAGGGGGAGGIIVLASPISLTVQGLLEAKGSNGGGAATFNQNGNTVNVGAGGGGSGGVIHVASPAINLVVTPDVSAGIGGFTNTLSAGLQGQGGAGGGACGGHGGLGGPIPPNSLNPGGGAPGEPGKTFSHIMDPTSLI
jgi:hypothetical protein